LQVSRKLAKNCPPNKKLSPKFFFPEKQFTEEVGQILSKRMGNLSQNILILIFF
jgi:hypothetical protein